MARAKSDDTTAAEESLRPAAATTEANQELQHTEGGVTTRMDATDLGVPMLPGDPSEPVGPEDALGPGPKRGDYAGRVGGLGYEPTSVEPDPDWQPPRVRDDGGVDEVPRVRVVYQRARAAERGEVAGVKGGVDTTE